MTITAGVAGATVDDPVDGGSGTSRLVNDGGAWTGFGGEFDDAEDIGTVWGPPLTAMWKLTGEGDYDGLTIILLSGVFPDGPRSWGMIGPADVSWWIPRPTDAG